LVLVFCIFTLNQSNAKEVLSSYNYLANGLLPQGVFTFAYNTGRTSVIKDRYNDQGQRISNSKWNSKKLSFNDLVDSSKDQTDKVLSSAAFKAFGIDLNSQAGEVKNTLDINTSSKVFVFGYGLNEVSNLFFIVPTIQIQSDVKSEFIASKSYDNLISDLRSSGQAQKADYLERVKRSPLKTRLNDNDQKLPSDINTISNLLINFRRKFSNVLSDTFFIIPYGYKYNTSDMIDYKLNDNSLGLKQGVGFDWNLNKKSILGLYGSYHYRSAFKMDYRIPRTENDPMSSDVEKKIKIKYGDQIELSTQYSYKWNSLLGNYFNLRYLYSFKDSYKGTAYSQQRYDILEKETDSKSLSAQIGVTVNTISSFIARKFLLPIDLNIQYSKTLYAKNSFDADWVSLNLMVFYK
jgi:hypothetical protein